MKRTILTCILGFLMIFGSTTGVFAANMEICADDTTHNPLRYVITSSARASLGFVGSTANATIDIKPKSSTSIDYIAVSSKIVNIDNDSTVVSWNEKIDRKNDNGRFIFTKTKKVTTRGHYQFIASVKCYKNNKLIETLQVKSNKVQY